MSTFGLFFCVLLVSQGIMTFQISSAEEINVSKRSFSLSSVSGKQTENCQQENEQCRGKTCCDGLECRTVTPKRFRCFNEGSTCDLQYNTRENCRCYDYWAFNTDEPSSLSTLTTSTTDCLFSPPSLNSTSLRVGVPICLTTCGEPVQNKNVLEGILEIFGEAEDGASQFANCVISNVKKLYPYAVGKVPECREFARAYKFEDPVSKLILQPSADATSALESCGVKVSGGSPPFKVQLSNINGFTRDRFMRCGWPIDF